MIVPLIALAVIGLGAYEYEKHKKAAVSNMPFPLPPGAKGMPLIRKQVLPGTSQMLTVTTYEWPNAVVKGRTITPVAAVTAPTDWISFIQDVATGKRKLYKAAGTLTRGAYQL